MTSTSIRTRTRRRVGVALMAVLACMVMGTAPVVASSTHSAHVTAARSVRVRALLEDQATSTLEEEVPAPDAAIQDDDDKESVPETGTMEETGPQEDYGEDLEGANTIEVVPDSSPTKSTELKVQGGSTPSPPPPSPPPPLSPPPPPPPASLYDSPEKEAKAQEAQREEILQDFGNTIAELFEEPDVEPEKEAEAQGAQREEILELEPFQENISELELEKRLVEVPESSMLPPGATIMMVDGVPVVMVDGVPMVMVDKVPLTVVDPAEFEFEYDEEDYYYQTTQYDYYADDYADDYPWDYPEDEEVAEQQVQVDWLKDEEQEATGPSALDSIDEITLLQPGLYAVGADGADGTDGTDGSQGEVITHLPGWKDGGETDDGWKYEDPNPPVPAEEGLSEEAKTLIVDAISEAAEEQSGDEPIDLSIAFMMGDAFALNDEDNDAGIAVSIGGSAEADGEDGLDGSDGVDGAEGVETTSVEGDVVYINANGQDGQDGQDGMVGGDAGSAIVTTGQSASARGGNGGDGGNGGNGGKGGRAGSTDTKTYAVVEANGGQGGSGGFGGSGGDGGSIQELQIPEEDLVAMPTPSQIVHILEAAGRDLGDVYVALGGDDTMDDEELDQLLKEAMPTYDEDGNRRFYVLGADGVEEQMAAEVLESILQAELDWETMVLSYFPDQMDKLDPPVYILDKSPGSGGVGGNGGRGGNGGSALNAYGVAKADGGAGGAGGLGGPKGCPRGERCNEEEVEEYQFRRNSNRRNSNLPSTSSGSLPLFTAASTTTAEDEEGECGFMGWLFGGLFGDFEGCSMFSLCF